MTDHEARCVGYIQITFFDDVSGEAITIGGAGFVTAEEDAAAWSDLVEFHGLMGLPISRLITDGRGALAAELARYRDSRAAA